MNKELNPYLQKLRYYKELYLIDEEAYGDWPPKRIEEMKRTLDDFVRYVELSSTPKPLEANGLGETENMEVDINFNNFKRYGFKF
jgi:hypothetical protein